MLQLFLTMTTIPLEENILRKCVISEGFDRLCVLCICRCDVELGDILAMDCDGGTSVTRRCAKPWGDVTGSSWSWGRNKAFSPRSHWGCKHQVGLLSSHVPPPRLAPASVTQSHLGIPGRYCFPPALSSTDRVKRSFVNEQLSALCALLGCRDWWAGS